MKPSPDALSAITKAANAVRDKLQADVLLYNGPIQRPVDAALLHKCRDRKDRAKNVVLILVTEGGDPDAAYRVSKFLQDHYERFYCLVSGYCKSAGTLIAIGAHELIFSPLGELGPLDVQMSKRDDLMEMQSGQTVITALSTLQAKAFMAFEQFFLDVQVNSGGRISLRTATDIAAQLTIGLFSPVYSQIDPMHVGEAGRASSIAQQYGARLNEFSGNLKPEALDFLISGYSNHGFVIDVHESKKLFKHVRAANDLEQDLLDALAEQSYKPNNATARIEFASDIIRGAKENANQKVDGAIAAASRPRKAPASARRGNQANGRDAGGLPQ